MTVSQEAKKSIHSISSCKLWGKRITVTFSAAIMFLVSYWPRFPAATAAVARWLWTSASQMEASLPFLWTLHPLVPSSYWASHFSASSSSSCCWPKPEQDPNEWEWRTGNLYRPLFINATENGGAGNALWRGALSCWTRPLTSAWALWTLRCYTAPEPASSDALCDALCILSWPTFFIIICCSMSSEGLDQMGQPSLHQQTNDPWVPMTMSLSAVFPWNTWWVVTTAYQKHLMFWSCSDQVI